ncbi:MAG TPA: hypothetical protein VMQ62_03615 [Dongiaceae bacterium]|nr:hypothetical protein [Dongiaceae bacterium]
MSEPIWTRKDLERFLRFEDPEVRYWAAERLTRHYPDESAGLLEPYLFDDHELTPELVAAYLGHHGSATSGPQLARAVGRLRGVAAARALEAMLRLGLPNAIGLVREAAERRDFDEECWSVVLEALADRGDPPARAALEEILRRRADWAGSPPILAAMLALVGEDGYRPVLQAWLRSLQWRGAADRSGDDSGESFRVLMDHLMIDDCGWCFRTTRWSRIDLHRTLKAIESAYDCDLRDALPAARLERLGRALEDGAYTVIAPAIADEIRIMSTKAGRPGDDLAERIAEAASFWGDPEVAQAVEALGPHLREWATGFLLSALFSMARYRNYELEVRRAGHDLGRLLPLLEIEASALVDALPPALSEAVEAAGPAESAARTAARRAVEERCLAVLAMRGPFFPQVTALATLGELGAAGAANEIIDFLGEENSYLYEAAEQALGSLGPAVVAPARARLEAGDLPEDAVHSLLLVLCELGTPDALRLILDQFDTFVTAVGAADAARWMSILGARELIDPLRRILPQDVAQVGQAVLLLAGIHNLHVPEENSIRRAIDDYWKEHPEGSEGGGEPGPDDGHGKYVM